MSHKSEIGKPPTILHADMDAFYASIEQLDDPTLRGKPVMVGGKGKRGVVAAASYEARRFGVRSAMPMSEARRRCPEGACVVPRMARYAKVSAAVREIFYNYTPLIEPLSLDEAYLDIEGSLRLFGTPTKIAESIRSEVRGALGLNVSVGVGPGKLVAKIASRKAKPDGFLLVESAQLHDFLRPLPVAEIWGVGRVTERQLHALGIATIGQLADFDRASLEKALGKWGQLLHALASGEDLRTVEGDRSRKSYGEENTFPEDVGDPELVEATVIAHAETVARRLRRDGVKGRTVTLKFRPSGRDYGFRLISRSRSLEEAVDDGTVISRTAMRLWNDEPEHPPLRLLGVQVSGLDRDRPIQMALFKAAEEDRQEALNAAVDDIVRRFGPSALRRGES
ncbi:MAG: DNA polymerase IV [Candidatus Binatia bacterium]